jgi:hypothetical protein
MTFARTPFGQQRSYGVIRSALISYGVAALTLLFSRSSGLGSATGGEASSAAQTLVLGGLALQVLLIVAGALVKHRAPESETAAQALMVLELLADGVTVFLFAWATLGAIMQASGNV